MIRSYLTEFSIIQKSVLAYVVPDFRSSFVFYARSFPTFAFLDGSRRTFSALTSSISSPANYFFSTVRSLICTAILVNWIPVLGSWLDLDRGQRTVVIWRFI